MADMHATPTLRELFEAALKLPPEARAYLLAGRCPDPARRAELELLLAADASEDGLLAAGEAAAAAQVIGEVESLEPLPAGSRVGPFELIEVLGEGGSSTVFRAFREVEGVRQEVALKLLARGLYTAEARRRFHHERAALTRLRHPGIARLIEGGVADNGLAYIALELIEGVPLTRYAQVHDLTERQRLNLFLQVCRAVESAHRALIVHRDLKPSNVMVTNEGEVKLLDFGIAKLLDDTGDVTRTRHHALTPAYAAPEQFTPGVITTATDVYALGVLLRELLSGERGVPNDAQAPSSGNVAGDDSPSPVQSAPRKLRGDLANISAKAAEREPERRYSSAGALAEDLERYLDRLPVRAHPPSRWYRAGRFVARHRSGVTIAAVLLAAILVSLSVALWQAHVADQQARRAEAIRDFVVNLLRKTAPDVPAKQRPDVPTLVYAAASALPASLRDQPATRAELLYTLGNVLHDMGDYPHSEALLRQAETSAARLPAASSIRVQTQVGLIRTLMREGDYTEAEQRMLPLLAIPSSRLPPDVSRARLLKLGMAVADGRREMSQAVARGREMLREYRTRCAVQHDCGQLSSATHDLAAVLLDADRIAEARPLADETLRLREQDATPMELANAYDLELKIALYRGDLDAADADAQKIEALIASLGNSLRRKPLEAQVIRIAVVLVKEDAREADRLASALLAEQRASGASLCDIAWTKQQQAQTNLLLRRPRAAVAISASAIKDGVACRRASDRDVTVTLAKLAYARALLAAGDRKNAEAVYSKASLQSRAMHADGPLVWPEYLVQSMRLAAALGHSDDAVRDAQTLITALDRAQALPTHPWWLEARVLLANVPSAAHAVVDGGDIDADIARIHAWPVGVRLAQLRIRTRSGPRP